ncbi:hypothetical protein JTE90_023105, partial [Oedothorax gibbosus]
KDAKLPVRILLFYEIISTTDIPTYLIYE